MLKELQEPLVSYEVGFQEMTASDFDKAAVGKRLRIVYPEISETVDTFITEIWRDYRDIERSSITVANRETSIASSVGTKSAASQVITSATSDNQTRTSSGGGATRATSSDGSRPRRPVQTGAQRRLQVQTERYQGQPAQAAAEP